VTILVELGATSPALCTPQADGSLPLTSLLESTLAPMLGAGLIHDALLAQTEAQRRAIWARREAAAEITYATAPFIDTDIALPLDQIGTFLRRIHARLPALNAGATTLTVGHLGDGNLHFTVFPTEDSTTLHDEVVEAIEDIVADLKGSFSAEHGVGLSKKASMARRKDPVALDVMRAIKAALDPAGRMNPGKVLP
jgi:FAD/FMN-containing dehydrogenase